MTANTLTRTLATLSLAAATALPFGAHAQTVSSPTAGPARVQAQQDRSTKGEIPLDDPTAQPPVDRSQTSSPVSGTHAGVFIPPGTPVSIRLQAPVSSGTYHNGQMVAASLTAPVTASNGKILAAGTPVQATVISSVAAGKMKSYGVLTLQVASIGGIPLISDVLSFEGQEGPKDVADAAPAKGTEATVDPGKELAFKVLGPGDTPDSGERASADPASSDHPQKWSRTGRRATSDQ